MAWLDRRTKRLMRRVVDNSKSVAEKIRKDIKEQLSSKYGVASNQLPLFPTGPVKMIVYYYKRLPNNAFVGGRRDGGLSEQYLTGMGGHTNQSGALVDVGAPDLDNLLKLTMDAAEGVVYCNDRQVVAMSATKLLDQELPCIGRTVIEFGLCAGVE